MSDEDSFDRLCTKTSDVVKILKHNECNLSDDTYLDHLITGIKDELQHHETQTKRLAFWDKSSCSNFVQTFGDQSNESQDFVLKLLKEVWKLHGDIHDQTLEIVSTMMKTSVNDRVHASHNFLELVRDLVFHKNAGELLRKNLSFFTSADTGLWDVILKPILFSLPNDLPQSHFWKEALVALAKEFVISCILHNEETRMHAIKFLYPDLASAAKGMRIFGEVLDYFLLNDAHLPEMETFHSMLEAFAQNECSVRISILGNKIKALVILHKYQEAQKCLLENQFLLLENKNSIRMWYKMAKSLVESQDKSAAVLDESLTKCIFKCLDIVDNNIDYSHNSHLPTRIQCLTNIKMNNELQTMFHDHVIEILKLIDTQSSNGNIDLTTTENNQLVQSSLTALRIDDATPLCMDHQKLKLFAKLSKNSYLNTHFQFQALDCIRSMVKYEPKQPNNSTDVSIQEVMLELWQHSLSGSDWKNKDMLLSILSTAFKNNSMKIANTENDDAEFPWTCLITFIHKCLDDNNSFIRSSSIGLISAIYEHIGKYKGTEWKGKVEQSLRNFYPTVVQLSRYDTEAIVRRSILREGVMLKLNRNVDLEAKLLGKFI